MSPLAHVLVALVPVVLYTTLRDWRLPSRWVVSAACLGGMVPDLVDKPLAHVLLLLPNGRVGVHSLPIALPLVAAILMYGWRTRRVRPAAAFGLGVVLHPLGDWHTQLVSGAVPAHLLWPFVSVPIQHTPSWSAYVPAWTAFAAVVLGATALVMARDLYCQLRHQNATYPEW